MAGFSDDRKPLTKIASTIEDHGYVIMTAIGPIGVGVFLTFVSDWWKNNFINS